MKLTHVHRISTTSRLTGHALYKQAKQGNQVAAQKVVENIIPIKNQFHYLEGYVCPVLKANGNKLPLALAYLMASHSNMTLYDSIYLQHTSHGSSMTERLYYQPSFSGMVKPADYVILDDVYTTGKTLKSLKNYIESKGGNVISA
jgi:orotate phosphoribosyltransferase-like protein